MLPQWTRERVIEAIRARHEQGLPIRGLQTSNQRLVSAAVRRFGTWLNAVAAAGLPVRPKRHLTAEMVIAALQQRHRAGLPLGGVSPYDRSLVYAARRWFGDWRQALLAAGIGGATSPRWTHERIIAELETLKQRGMPLTTNSASAALYDAIRRHFGGWHEALEAAGLERRHPRCHRWTREGIVDEIQNRQRQRLSLSIAANRRLAEAARRHFGSWMRAVHAAGVTTKTALLTWSRARVFEEIRALQASDAFEHTTWTENRKLAAAAKRHFGSWRLALIAAGVLAPHERRRCRRKWTDQRIIAAIQDRYIRGLPLVANHDKNLATAASRNFGSWHAAVAAAGLDPGEKPKPRQRWSEDRVIEAIRKRKAERLPLRNLGTILPGLVCAARRHCGSWQAALRAAGVLDENHP